MFLKFLFYHRKNKSLRGWFLGVSTETSSKNASPEGPPEGPRLPGGLGWGWVGGRGRRGDEGKEREASEKEAAGVVVLFEFDLDRGSGSWSLRPRSSSLSSPSVRGDSAARLGARLSLSLFPPFAEPLISTRLTWRWSTSNTSSGRSLRVGGGIAASAASAARRA